MIPKIIHYCWFGKAQKPVLAEKCIKSWMVNCPDYQIIEWNEDNYDLSTAPLYVRQAYQEKKWAFVTDYVRLKVVYENGGIYLDTDVELRKSLDFLLQYSAYFGFEDNLHINTGLGFGAQKACYILFDMMQDYNEIPFVFYDGSFDTTPCPQRNTSIFVKYGLVLNNKMQVLKDNIMILPSNYLNPLNYQTGRLKISSKTVSIHWYSASWRTQQEKEDHERHIVAVQREKIDTYKHLPNRVVKKMFGEKKYERIKQFIKKR